MNDFVLFYGGISLIECSNFMIDRRIQHAYHLQVKTTQTNIFKEMQIMLRLNLFPQNLSMIVSTMQKKKKAHKYS